VFTLSLGNCGQRFVRPPWIPSILGVQTHGTDKQLFQSAPGRVGVIGCFFGQEKRAMLARQIVVGFGIAAIFPWLILYGLSTVYPQPKREDFFGVELAPPPSATAEERKAYAEQQKKSRDAFNVAARNFARVLFSISTVLGVAAIAAGAHITSNTIGAGLILGGISSLAIGYWGHAYYLDNWMRFLSLLAGFGALLYVGFRKHSRS